MVFVHPMALWLLLLSIPLVLLHRGGRTGLGRGRGAAVVAVRVAGFVLLVMALARPVLERTDRTQTVVLVADVSSSIDAAQLKDVQQTLQMIAARKQPHENLRLVVFDAEARQAGLAALLSPSDSLGLRGAGRSPEPGPDGAPGSALADALDLAGALIPQDGRGRVLVFTDGLQTGGDAEISAERLARRGVAVEVTPVGVPRSEETILRQVALPATAGVGSTVDLKAEIECSRDADAELIVIREGEDDPIVTRLALRAGRQWVSCRCPLREEGVARYTVRVESAVDTLTSNNQLPAAVCVGPPRRVLVVEDAPAVPAAAALAELAGAGASVTSVAPSELDSPKLLETADLLVIADTPAELITAPAQQAIADGVRGGLGLLVTGGRRSFGPGGYANTPLSEVLPLRFSQEIERRDPSSTLVVIIDTSGSMGGARVNLAREIARLSIARLKPHDKVGIVEFYGSKRWAAPIQPASNAIDLQRALNRLTAGGGTVILPAIEEAYYALQNVRTRTKHVLVLTDGGVEPGAFEPLIRRMADAGITLSTVMVGPGGHSAFLASLAQWGRGRFYASPDRFNLPEIIIKQPRSSLLTPFVEQASTLSAGGADPLIEGIDFAAAPAIEGYVQTEARPTADVVVSSSHGHPVLAKWRYGLGTVAALTTQVSGDWSADLAQWPPYARLVSNLVRSASRPGAAEALLIRPVPRPGALEVQVATRLPAAAEELAAIELTLTDQAGAARQWTLDPIRSGEWNHRVSDLSPGVSRLQARSLVGDLAGDAVVTIPPAREVTALAADDELLGRLDAFRADASRRAAELSGRQARRPYELWPLLVGGALLVFLLNVLLRRWPGHGTALALGGVAVLMLLPAESPAAPSPGSGQPLTASPVAFSAEVVEPIDRALAAGDPTDRERHYLSACRSAWQRDGNLHALLAYLQTKQDGDSGAALLLARAARSNGDLALARETLVRQAADATASVEVFGELARVAELQGDDQAALAALEQAIVTVTDSDSQFALRVRLASILAGSEDAEAGRRALEAIAAGAGHEPARVAFCAHLASLLGEYDLAADLLKPLGTPKQRFHAHLFRGLWLLRAGRPGQAQAEFELAHGHASLARDRRFALERVIAAARSAGRLPDLADRWLADASLTPDRLTSLVSILRELGRPDDALTLLRRPAATPEQQRLIDSPAFQQQVITVAAEAGREREAEAAYRSLLAQRPQRVDWRAGLARLMLLDGRRQQAIALFGDGVQGAEDARQLMDLAQAARDLSLDASALQAARKAGSTSKSARIRAGLFEADLARLRGDSDQAIRLLKELVDLAGQDANALLPVAEAFERYGDKIEALRRFKQLYDQTGAEDVLLRVAWLMEENQHFEQAYLLWQEMWQTTDVPARLRQAQERLLDLASRSGKLADLAIDLEERLDDGRGGERELSLLVDIYTVANDPISAAEILQDFSRRSGGQIDMLQRLARVYLSCEQFGRCNAILHKLVTLDPDNAADHLQQLAIVALERNRPHDAKTALARLANVAGGDDVVDEFSAGVLDMIGLHEEAAWSYGRVLARHPDRIEAYLLWGNAMKAAGQAERAVARFQDLIEQAAEDDLFTVAIDGLLNLNARPPVLRSALRRVYARIAAKPDKVFLYRLAVDLLESLDRSREMTDVLEQAVVVAGERRGALLRELMDTASADGRHDRLIHFGRSLVALGDEVPPQVFLDLGRAMIEDGHHTLAEQVFDRASFGADYSLIQQRVATYYEQADLPATADRITRELLIAEPDNVALLLRSGALGEQMGQFDRAYAQYDRAVDLMLRRMPRVIRADDSAEERTGSGPPQRRPRRASNLDELAQYFDTAAEGLLNVARSETQRQRLLDDLLPRVDRELEALSADRLLAPVIARNPGLERLASFARRAAFSLRVPDAADRMDGRLAGHYPRDEALLSELVQTRVTWGLYARAAALAAAGDAELAPPPGVTLQALLADPGRIEALLSSGQVDAALGARLVPLLVMTGQDDKARRALGVVQPGAGAEAGTTPATMMAAAIALGDSEALWNWSGVWLDSCTRTQDGEKLIEGLRRCIRLVWNHLTPERRAALASRLTRLSAALDHEDRLALDLLRWRLARGQGLPFEDFDGLAQEAARDESLDGAVLADLLEASPAAKRPGLLRSMVSARKPDSVREFLFDMAGRLTVPLDQQFVDVFVELFSAAPQPRLPADRVFSFLDTGWWKHNHCQPELVRRIGELLLSEAPDRTAVLVTVSVARQTAGLHEEAALLAQEAIDALVEVKTPGFTDRRMLGDVLDVMSPSDIEEALAELSDRQEIEGATPTLLLVKGLLLAAADRPEASRFALQSAYEMAPTNRAIDRQLITALKAGGQEVRLCSLLARHLTRRTIYETYEWRTLGTLYRELYNPIAALPAAQQNQTFLGPVESMCIMRMMGQDDRVLTTLRRFLIKNRRESRFFAPYWPDDASPAGMVGHLAGREAERRPRQKIFVRLADAPFAEEEFTGLLTAAPPDRRDVDDLADGLVKATQAHGTRPRLMAALLEAEQGGALTVKDDRMIMALAEEDPVSLPEALAGRLDTILIHTDAHDHTALDKLAGIASARGRTGQARWILRWQVARDLLAGHGRARLEERFERIDALLAVLPAEERDSSRQRWLNALAPTPLDLPSAELEAARLTRWAESGDTATLEAQVARCRQLIEGDIGYPPRYPHLAAAVARCDAGAERLEEFALMIERAYPRWLTSTTTARLIDCHDVLPPAAMMGDPLPYVDVVAELIDARREDGDLARTRATESLCLLGAWCVDNGLAERAGALTDKAAEGAGPPGRHWLWIADLARRTGNEGRAAEIETRLLLADMIPVARVPALLDSVEAGEGQAKADRLALRVAEYSDHPVVLKRAARSARQAGDLEAATTYQRRLEAVTSDDPTGAEAGR